jgi:hypothetical protein
MPTACNELDSANRRLARQFWGASLNSSLVLRLQELSQEFHFSISKGDLILLNQNWYVTHAGLLRLAKRKRCIGIEIEPVLRFSDPISSRFSFKATVYKSKACRGFTGYGDADPSNVSPMVRGAEMRVAETRAVNRALRKAYGIGTCSAEEIGSFERSSGPERPVRKLTPESSNGSNGRSGNGNSTRLRDRLCQIIRQHKLDAERVKSYAIEFCGAKTLREASREQVEAFVTHLANSIEKDRNALLSQLNSYAPQKEGAA